MSPEIYAVFCPLIKFPTLFTERFKYGGILNTEITMPEIPMKYPFSLTARQYSPLNGAKQKIIIVNEEDEGFEVSLTFIPWS